MVFAALDNPSLAAAAAHTLERNDPQKTLTGLATAAGKTRASGTLADELPGSIESTPVRSMESAATEAMATAPPRNAAFNRRPGGSAESSRCNRAVPQISATNLKGRVVARLCSAT